MDRVYKIMAAAAHVLWCMGIAVLMACNSSIGPDIGVLDRGSLSYYEQGSDMMSPEQHKSPDMSSYGSDTAHIALPGGGLLECDTLINYQAPDFSCLTLTYRAPLIDNLAWTRLELNGQYFYWIGGGQQLFTFTEVLEDAMASAYTWTDMDLVGNISHDQGELRLDFIAVFTDLVGSSGYLRIATDQGHNVHPGWYLNSKLLMFNRSAQDNYDEVLGIIGKYRSLKGFNFIDAEYDSLQLQGLYEAVLADCACCLTRADVRGLPISQEYVDLFIERQCNLLQ